VSPRTELIIKNNELDNTEDEKINIESKQYNDLLKIYEIAMHQVVDTMNSIKERLNNMYGYTIIEKIDSRVKSKKSIMNKIKKKGIAPTYKSLVDNVDDIAGIRIVCPLKDDIFFIKQIIQNMPTLNVIEEKDYKTNQKITDSKMTPKDLSDLVVLFEKKEISNKMVKELLPDVLTKEENVATLVSKSGNQQISNKEELEKIIKIVLERIPTCKEDYQTNKDRTLKYLMGMVMKESKGLANPGMTLELLNTILNC